jgi:CMP-N-acetylneuraminic acid synthetase
MIDAIVPARGGSKGLPKKNIKLLNNHPLIAYSIVFAKLCKNVSDIYVSTDSKEIAGIAEKYGAKVPFLRPKEYSTDESPDYDFLKHFFENVDIEEVLLLRPTQPMRNPNYVDKAVEFYFENKASLSCLRSVEESHPPYKGYKIIDGYCETVFDNMKKDSTNLPRQSFPACYHPNGHFDIIKKEIIEQNSTLGDKIYPYISEKIIDIDNQHDFDIIDCQIGSKFDFISEHLRRNCE